MIPTELPFMTGNAQNAAVGVNASVPWLGGAAAGPRIRVTATDLSSSPPRRPQ